MTILTIRPMFTCRMLGLLKGFVGYKARPEGSIAEGYISKECTTFCSLYLHGVETVFNREERNYDGGDNGPGLTIFTQNVRPFGHLPRAIDVSIVDRELAHWFVLHNSLEVDEYLEYDFSSYMQHTYLTWFIFFKVFIIPITYDLYCIN